MDNLVEGGAVVAVTVGLVQVSKQYVPAKYIPLLSIGFGVLVSLAYAFSQGMDLITATIQGVVVGLTASGAYDTVRGVAKKGE